MRGEMVFKLISDAKQRGQGMEYPFKDLLRRGSGRGQRGNLDRTDPLPHRMLLPLLGVSSNL